MSEPAQLVITNSPDAAAIEQALIRGDLAGLNVNQRLAYYKQVCESVGLNPLTKPFEFIALNGKLQLYALRAATDQLRKVHCVSICKIDKERMDELYVVTAYARDAKGREDSSTGAVVLGGLKGEALANQLMKAETKAKRRVTLSICGLGLLDETEVASIPEVLKRAEKEEQANYEAQHAHIIARAEGQKPENENQETITEVNQDIPQLIDDSTRRKLFALARHSKVSHEDLKQYLSEIHCIASTKGITTAMLPDITAWLESVREPDCLEQQLKDSLLSVEDRKQLEAAQARNSPKLSGATTTGECAAPAQGSPSTVCSAGPSTTNQPELQTEPF